MKPNERIFIDDFYQLFGRKKYAEQWNDYIIHFLHKPDPDLDYVEGLSDEEAEFLKTKGIEYNKMARKNGLAVKGYFLEHLDKVFFSDNFRTSYEYHGEILEYDFLKIECEDKNGKPHTCQITLKSASEFIDNDSIELFDVSVRKTLKTNNKALLVSRAILIYFKYFGVPSNRKTLVGKIKDGYQAAYDEQVNENLIYDAIAVMSDVWNKELKK